MTESEPRSDFTGNAATEYQKLEGLGAVRGGFLWRGRRVTDGTPVLLKQPERGRLTGGDQLRREYDLLRLLDVPSVIKPIELLSQGQTPLLVLEGFDGGPLEVFLASGSSKLDWRTCVRIGIELSEALLALHERNLIHRDLMPKNLLIASDKQSIRLVDLSRTASLPAPPLAYWTRTDADFAYLSPEQTGRMNRLVDHRADFYALGIVLYRMITGGLPFSGVDRLEWTHSHIARVPAAPRERAPEIPETLSRIVLTLLAKDPDERYQTAYGLRYDLESCLEFADREPALGFSIRTRDIPKDFRIPGKLYGRELELRRLLDTVDQVADSGQPALLLVSGYAGVGKSSLIQEAHQSIALKGGIFLSGKFDPLKREIPYATISDAFRGLSQHIQASGNHEISLWRERLARALGQNGEVITTLIPQLESIIGKQPKVPPLPPVDAKNRFHHVFCRFIGAVAQAGKPLVLFLDDAQWANADSLSLIAHVLTHPEIRDLMVIEAYRDNEVGPAHPLMQSVERIRESLTPLEIHLGPLDEGSLSHLLAETLRCDLDHVAGLQSIVRDKTRGNPFFVKQFLKMIHRDGLLSLDLNRGSWSWDDDDLQRQRVTDNVVELMSAEIVRLGERTRRVLTLCACLGSKFDLETLALISNRSPADIGKDLAKAVRQGLILPTSDDVDRAVSTPSGPVMPSYAWLHDRVRQAAYSLIDKAEAARLHLTIARRLSPKTSVLDEAIFSVANQYNLGASLITDKTERLQVAELNLAAGRKAMGATAYASAIHYLSAGIELAGPEVWEEHYELAYSLYLDRADCELYNGNLEVAEQLAGLVWEKGRSTLDRAEAGLVRQLAQVSMGQYAKMAATGRALLALLGISLPSHPTRQELALECQRINRLIGGRSIESLRDLPPLTNPELEVALRVAPFAFQQDPNLLSLQVARMVSVTLEHGVSDASLLWFGMYSLVLAGEFDDFSQAVRFARLGAELAERGDLGASKGRHSLEKSRGAQFLLGLMIFWTPSLDGMIDLIRKATANAAERGDQELVEFYLQYIAASVLARGDPLQDVLSEMERLLSQMRGRDAREQMIAGRQFVKALLGRSWSFSTFSDEHFDQTEFEAKLVGRSPNLRCWYWIYKLRACFLAGEFKAALRAAQKAKPFLWAVAARPPYVDFHFYRALSLAALFRQGTEEERKAWTAILERSLKRFKAWSNLNAKLFHHFYALVAAEVARVTGRDREAARRYEEALDSARAGKFVQYEALVYELAARFYAEQRFSAFAELYLREANAAYQRWGAEGKVRWLEERHPALRERRWLGSVESFPEAAGLDPLAVLKASLAISGQIVLEPLLKTLMRIVMESAGADKAWLVLIRDGKLTLEAQGIVEDSGFNVMLDGKAPETPLPMSILNYVRHSREKILLADASQPHPFSSDEYWAQHPAKSVLCLPILTQAELVGLLYLENNVVTGAFTADRLMTLDLLAAQAAISLENAYLYRELEVAVRLRDEFLSIASHELRTPVHSLRLTLEALTSGLVPPSKDNVIRAFNTASRQIDRLTKLIEELLIVSRIQGGYLTFDLEPVDLAVVVRTTTQRFEAELARAHCRLTIDAEPEVVGVWDRSRLDQVVTNLLSNAIKFGKGNPIEVTVRNLPRNRAQLVVADHGIGIHPERLAYIFDRFERAVPAREYGGLGLGLYIVRSIVEKMGGSVSVESRQGIGSTFTVDLPKEVPAEGTR